MTTGNIRRLHRRGRATHPRNTAPMRASPRCGARTRDGTPCRAPAVTGRPRCRMHGGAAGSGAPAGNRNAVRHGFYRRAAVEIRKRFAETLAKMEKAPPLS